MSLAVPPTLAAPLAVGLRPPHAAPAAWAAVWRIALYAGMVVAPSLIAAWAGAMGGGHTVAQQIANSLALVGFSIVALQFVVSARWKWVEWPFGLDMIFLFHRAMAVWAGALLLAHPLLMAWGSGDWFLWTRPLIPWPIQLGRIALLTAVVLILISIFRASIGLSFERWRRIHNVLALGLLGLGFAHSTAIGTDFASWPLRIIWSTFAGVALVSYGYHRFVWPRWHRRRPYEVAEVRQESHNVWTLKLRPPEAEPCCDYLPGQFHFLTLYRRQDLPAEEHPFTISSSPTQEGYRTSTIKESGDFTRLMRETRAGDRAAVRGPYGRFSYLLHPDETDLVFIAGGIGVTPLMSMLRHMRDTRSSKTVLLVFASRTRADIVFSAELDEILAGGHPRLRVVNVLSEPEANWTGERGHIDRELILRHVKEPPAGKGFYLCGPAGMNDAVTRVLRGLGVPGHRIHGEKFAL